MNATSGNFNNFAVSLSNNSGVARNSVVGGGRHIPLTKFTRGTNRSRAAAQDPDSTKRVS